MGEGAGDTFDGADLAFLTEASQRRMPGYRPEPHENGATAWMVLEPDTLAAMPRFTICRIDPCIMVQIEEAGQRRFISVASLDDAMVIAERAVCEAHARCNMHEAPALAQ